MDTYRIRRGLALAALVPLLTGLTACSDSRKSTGDNAQVQDRVCGMLPSADPSAKLPPGFPARDQVLYEPTEQGKTTIVFGLVDEASFLEVRDDYVDKLKAAGWKIDGTDQESVEAEAQFSKSPPLQTGTIKVEPLCKGYVTVRYKANL